MLPRAKSTSHVLLGFPVKGEEIRVVWGIGEELSYFGKSRFAQKRPRKGVSRSGNAPSLEMPVCMFNNHGCRYRRSPD